MGKIILFKNDEGGVSVMNPSKNHGRTVEEIAEKDVPDGKPYVIVDESIMPTDRAFRPAWELDEDLIIPANSTIRINMSKAKNFTKDRLREERKPLMDSQDIEFVRALETGADTTVIITEKQRLRDITSSVDNVNTLAGLKVLRAER
jgi:hypothetical protein